VSSDADRAVDRIGADDDDDDDDAEDDVWYADESVWLTVVEPEECVGAFEGVGMDAVAIDKRERTRSKGYVEPLQVL
jgi:hypothetical protein